MMQFFHRQLLGSSSKFLVSGEIGQHFRHIRILMFAMDGEHGRWRRQRMWEAAIMEGFSKIQELHSKQNIARGMLLEEDDPRLIFTEAHCKKSEAVLYGGREAAMAMATPLTKTVLS